VAFAYLVAGPGATDAQLAPYRASLAATGAGLLASVLVAIPRGAEGADESQAGADHAAPSARPRRRTDAGRHTEPGGRHAEPGGRHTEPGGRHGDDSPPAPGAAPAPAPSPAWTPAAASLPRGASTVVPTAAASATAAGGTVYASESRPAIGRPPKGYEEYSDWLKDLSDAPGRTSSEPV
jgi:hypothetical protein